MKRSEKAKAGPKRNYCWHPVLIRVPLPTRIKQTKELGWPKGWRCTNCQRTYLLRESGQRQRKGDK